MPSRKHYKVLASKQLPEQRPKMTSTYRMHPHAPIKLASLYAAESWLPDAKNTLPETLSGKYA